MADDVTYLGRTTFRRTDQPFGVHQADRLSHVYIVGKTGVGKSTLLEAMAYQDARDGRGFALVDPHGDLATRLAETLPREARARLIYLDAADPRQPFGYNPLHRVRQDKIPLAVSGLLETLRKLWPDAWGMRMEHVFRNCLYALLEQADARLPDILTLLQDDDYRKVVVRQLRNPTVRDFWRYEYENYPARLRAEAIAPIQNKLGALLSDPLLYRILVEPSIDLRFRGLIDQGKILLVNLCKGQIGEDSAHILGGLIASTLSLAAFSRAELAAERRRPFILYLDEFQSFTTLSVINMMSELRKYGVGLTLAHQHLHQLDPDIRHAVLGNAATLIVFRVGPEDAQVLAKEFQPQFEVEDLLNLPNQHIYLKLMIDGTPSPPFSARTLRPDDLTHLGLGAAPLG
ncbi:type IV secretory system conjugative DNA transfer family protein [Phenylobacterium aquaticum]|uniref:type IV secretory system conjugative DNA transfer family protein n=1 Tax=Phenylobacterium aquaticum TaxID=1763816 RepID=UPI001F5C5FC0|nr:type IV secretion system DNA-binding domain-containing protein [Phenylobacterium aquaticum]MCI3133126.1 type IV secretion system DNA-binding domain-containing protein [Phenylobacterium aquaticum]